MHLSVQVKAIYWCAASFQSPDLQLRKPVKENKKACSSIVYEMQNPLCQQLGDIKLQMDSSFFFYNKLKSMGKLGTYF